jgi:hypothetical protein
MTYTYTPLSCIGGGAVTCIKIIDTLILTNYTNDAYYSDASQLAVAEERATSLEGELQAAQQRETEAGEELSAMQRELSVSSQLSKGERGPSTVTLPQTSSKKGDPGRCHVIELDKIRIFIYIPWTKSGLLTLFTYTRTGLFTI